MTRPYVVLRGHTRLPFKTLPLPAQDPWCFQGLLGTYVLKGMMTEKGNKRETHFTDKFMASPVHTALPWHKSEVSETGWPQLIT